MELTDADAAAPYALNVNRRTSRRLANQVEKKKSNEKAMEKVYQLGLKDVAGSLFFGGALYFATGSRNSGLIPFLGDFLYEEEEQWLVDRKAGLYSPVPAEFLAAYVCLVAALGVVIERLVLFYGTAGDTNLCLQLSVVALINGGFLELSRIDSGEKGVTRDEAELNTLWESEFEEFAEKKIVRKDSGSCHRNDVVKAYRRFYAKYRTNEVEGGPSDIDIEQLFVQWNKRVGSGVLASQAGFVKGVVLIEEPQL
ncbi:hypothetical protein TrVE_jg4524 [Triparma verrucosa]|nr:hypothetical protein TrVE_jg4524 [Triparma verrucosa]